MRIRGFAATAISSLIAASVLSTAVLCAESTVSTKTKSIAVFKNGLGFYVRQGDAKLKDGWATTDVVPNAALGTYWIGSPKPGIMIERLISTQEEITRTVPAVSVSELIDANVGKRIRFVAYHSGQGGDVVQDGILLSVAPDRKPDPKAPAYPMYTLAMQPMQGSYVTIRTTDLTGQESNTMVMDKNALRQVEFKGDINTDHKIKEIIKQFRFKVAGAQGDKAPVTVGYMQKGISWSPAYMVDLTDDKTARITMQGLLTNDVEDIEGATVHLVVGYPNFIFSDQISPLALTQSVSDFIQNISRSSGQPMGGIYSQSLSLSNYAGSYDRVERENAPAAPSFGYSTTSETPGVNEEDLFLYEIKDVELKKGERAYYTVFSADVPYKHVYEWLIPDTTGIDTSGSVRGSYDRGDKPEPQNHVWHKLRLTNNSKYPWTTAPAMAMSKGEPLAQDKLDYTAKGGAGDLKLTVATDISASKSEEEKSRQLDALKLSYTTFQKINSVGTLTLKNFKSTTVTVTVKKTLVGDVSATSDNGKAVKMAQGVNSVNPTTVITWDIPLKPGEEKKVTYDYSVYIHY